MSKIRKALFIVLPVIVLLAIWSFISRETVGPEDFLGLEGIHYRFTGYVLKPSALEAPLGPITDKVTSDSTPARLASDKFYATAHGLGTQVFQLKSYFPTFRVGVRRGRKVYIYEASYNTKARTARELLDIGDKLVKVEIAGKNKEVTITHQETLDKLTRYVQDGAVDHQKAMEVAFSSGLKRDYRIIFFLKDKTSVTKTYYLCSNHLWPGIQLEGEFKAFFYQLLNDSD